MVPDSAVPAQEGLLREAQVTVVGLGLMGGSLSGALKTAGACRRVVGAVRRPETAVSAVEKGWVDAASTTLADTVAQADVVVMAAPVRTIIEMLPPVGRLVRPGCLVMDLGSTKVEIVRTLAGLPEGVEVLGGHPMCGKESSGLEAAEPTLFQDRVFVLTPLKRTGGTALALAHELVRAIGARPLILEAEEHDQLVASVSHLPYLLACGLVRTADGLASTRPVLWQLASSGFCDTSRLAASNVEMMVDILLTNREAVLTMLRGFETQSRALAELLDTRDESGLKQALEAAALRRRSLFQ